jgi:hypothetical protein
MARFMDSIVSKDYRRGGGRGSKKACSIGTAFFLKLTTMSLIKGWFNESLPGFLAAHEGEKVSFIHIDCDLYSSTKYILDALKDRMDTDCVIVFDELVNYPGFDGDTGELKAFYEFITENKVEYEWIGMDGVPTGMLGYSHENVALIIRSINRE